jgi:hypothetical protein|tara:strand:- start:5877 stop:6389 length:513 start_codon:yes stop_codon:yes gene_type:complete
MIRLFDVLNGEIIPTEHCYTMLCYKKIMDGYPDEYLNIYAYLFYLSCPNPEFNPFFDVPENDKEELIRREVGGEFDSDDELIQNALDVTKSLYDTPTVRAYMGIKGMLDKLAKYMENTAITDGRDGNITALINAAKNFESVRQSFKGVLKDLQEEQLSTVRGGQRLSYDT